MYETRKTDKMIIRLDWLFTLAIHLIKWIHNDSGHFSDFPCIKTDEKYWINTTFISCRFFSIVVSLFLSFSLAILSVSLSFIRRKIWWYFCGQDIKMLQHPKIVRSRMSKHESRFDVHTKLYVFRERYVWFYVILYFFLGWKSKR